MFYQWLQKKSKAVVNSIAFYPAIIAGGFLLLSYLILRLDFSEYGKGLKSQFSWITLKDATTARTIAGTIAGSVLSLTVFSFSMVMILLVQSATNLSNRMLDVMIGNRFQQVVLGFYIGTIVYALFILSTIRDVASGIYIPALSVYTLIGLTIIDIFLFIYFLHFITQSVKYQVVISKVHSRTVHSLKRLPEVTSYLRKFNIPETYKKTSLTLEISGYYQSFDEDSLFKVCAHKDYFVEVVHAPGTYLLKGQTLAEIGSAQALSPDDLRKIRAYFSFYEGQPIAVNPDYGFFQLMEIAIKALSPGINDPGTAVLSLNALTDLLNQNLEMDVDQYVSGEDGKARIFWKLLEFKDLFEKCMRPIWDYGKDDYLIQNEITEMLFQLRENSRNPQDKETIDRFYQITLAYSDKV